MIYFQIQNCVDPYGVYRHLSKVGIKIQPHNIKIYLRLSADIIFIQTVSDTDG
jgi:hypothetical protein